MVVIVEGLGVVGKSADEEGKLDRGVSQKEIQSEERDARDSVKRGAPHTTRSK